MTSAPTGARPLFCYVVLCHADAPAALRLARRIRVLSPGSAVLLRHAQHDEFLTADDAGAAGAHLLRSAIGVSWGLWSLTGAALEALTHARAVVGADHYVLLSGHDYPLRDLAAWERELVASGAGASFARFTPRDQDWQYRWRIVRMPHRLDPVPHPVKRVVERGWRRLGSPVLEPVVKFYRLGNRGTAWGVALRRPRLALRRPPLPITCGSFWLTASAPALDRLLARHRDDPRLAAFFGPTLVPDEHFLQSLLDDDPATLVRDAPTTYQRVPPGDWNSVPIDLAEVPAAVASGAPFMRKVPVDAADVVALADQLSQRVVAQVAQEATGPPDGGRRGVPRDRGASRSGPERPTPRG